MGPRTTRKTLSPAEQKQLEKEARRVVALAGSEITAGAPGEPMLGRWAACCVTGAGTFGEGRCVKRGTSPQESLLWSQIMLWALWFLLVDLLEGFAPYEKMGHEGKAILTFFGLT